MNVLIFPSWAAFFYKAKLYSIAWMDQFVYLFIHPGPLKWLPPFNCSESCCCERMWTNISWVPAFHSLGVYGPSYPVHLPRWGHLSSAWGRPSWGRVCTSRTLSLVRRDSLVAQTANARDMGLIPGSGRCPGERNDYPLQYSARRRLIGKDPGGGKDWRQKKSVAEDEMDR